MENSSVAQSQAVWGHLELIRAVTFRNLNTSIRRPNYPRGRHFEQDSCLRRFGRVSWQHCYPHHPPLAENFLTKIVADLGGIPSPLWKVRHFESRQSSTTRDKNGVCAPKKDYKWTKMFNGIHHPPISLNMTDSSSLIACCPGDRQVGDVRQAKSECCDSLYCQPYFQLNGYEWNTENFLLDSLYSPLQSKATLIYELYITNLASTFVSTNPFSSTEQNLQPKKTTKAWLGNTKLSLSHSWTPSSI